MNPIFLSLIISSKAVTGTAPIINNTHFIIRKGHLNYNKFVKKRRNKNTNPRLVFLAKLLFKLLILFFYSNSLFEFFIRIYDCRSLFFGLCKNHPSGCGLQNTSYNNRGGRADIFFTIFNHNHRSVI